MLLRFETKRMIEGKDWLGMLVGMIVMIIAAVINSVVVQPMYDGSANVQYDYYCGISQLMPFVFAPSIGNYFTKDCEDGANYFYKNIGISKQEYYFTRFFVVIFFGVGIIALGTSLYFYKERTDFISGIGVLVVLLLQYIYTILLSALVAYFTKKRIVTIVTIIFGTMILSVINILPIPVIRGHLFMLDGHSVITENVNKYLVQNNTKYFFESIFILSVWILILLTVYYLGILMEQKGRK